MADKRKGIRIKNEETCRIISELATLEGVTKTEAVRRALKERLERSQYNLKEESSTGQDNSGAKNPDHQQT